MKIYPIDRIKRPFVKMMKEEKSGSLVLGFSILVAFALANSPWHEQYHLFFEHKLGFQFDGKPYLEYTISEWINDGLMAMFFFVVGLELKREIVAGELSNIRKAMLPISAAIGGMIVPAIIYLLLNPTGEVHSGWGIPMATDIALALGVLYLLGNRIPLVLKVFLTALAIVDDLGAVLVIAFFYTSNISFLNLALGFAFLMLMFIGNRLGVRNLFYYAIIGIVGVWTAFLLSGIHATIAAVLAAFMIPAEVRIKEGIYVARIKKHLLRFTHTDPNDNIPTLTHEQLEILERVNEDTKRAMPPLQKLEHAMTPFVNFVVLPIFALANAGVTVFNIDVDTLFNTNVAIGVGLGLILGKLFGIVGFSWLAVKLKISSFPKEMNLKNLAGLALLASIGFTMSLFITQLAFSHEEYKTQAKIGIFVASILGGLLGYLILRKQPK
ncbi:Na+/H+ antiporter NhaA [Aequorivita viscosa]|uniref:Na(+)/H(+) antiporter NhaA n=1 Tax=Aequorivita viscosa TaxID=797419 RepID=A0A1M6LSF1_9FLAO|nr:Na+/H+ antiporter NhaA [Aequorivita viscosa]SDX26046.1 Na+:H+ antiporter, NhaA family [Aequorivita viscosa]SHJ74131.1 Na+:H+ antiporter, NhaA family [Aequorivita viscosa]